MDSTPVFGEQTGSWPVLDPYEADSVAFWTPEGGVTRADLMARAEALAARLPARSLAINYCVRRDMFAVALLAFWMRGQTALFPADRGEHTFRNLYAEQPDIYSLSDDALPFDNPANIVCGAEDLLGLGSAGTKNDIPAVPWTHPAVRVFTSGSTGKPSVNEKSWGMLVAGGKAIPPMLELDRLATPTVVATVPSQHMYGFETAIMNVLQAPLAAHTERPVYPADIARCLGEVPAPRILVTTPVHLRALVEGRSRLPSITKVVSATAPLSVELAAAAEDRLGAPVWEIYGFTEVGSVAGRHTTASGDWTLRPDLRACRKGDDQFVDWAAFGHRIPFPDLVQILDPGHIRLQGRSQDIVNIAGKRASLSGLSATLTAIDGVEDGVFWLPAEDAGMGVVARLIAFAVAPTLSEENLRSALKKKLDPVFVPRRIYFVDALPRNATGKLTQQAMTDLMTRHRNDNAKA